MEETWLLFIISSSSFLLLLHISKHFFPSKSKNLPPSPPSLPIIGHLHHLVMKRPIHRTLQNLSEKYGPILDLSFGNRNVLLISSPSAVEECLSKNDLIFANRPRLLVGKYLNYDYSTIVTASYGDHWRNLRRLSTLEIFSTKSLNMFLGIRQDEVRLLVKNLYRRLDKDFTKVEMKSKLSDLSFNIIMRMVAGKRYFGEEAENSEESNGFLEFIRETFEVSGAFNPGDYLPFFRWVDYQSFEKKIIRLQKKGDRFLQSLIDEHRNKRDLEGDDDQAGKSKTIIDTMLLLQESKTEDCSDETIKGMISNLLSGGTDTSSVTLEWAMSLLLNHPVILNKARAEIDNYIIGRGRCLVEEQDVPNLHFIQNIINETLRLYPAGPLLVPHESSNDCTVCGFDVPKSTILIVNAWAIHRDPNVWENPTSFKPERFEGKSKTEGNSSYKFFPFGLGRRACPGAGLANKVMTLTLAVLIQCFEWERIGEEEVDMSEGTGLTMPKVKPLEVLCKARESMVDVLSML